MKDSIADYIVYDALGMRIGHISGVLRDSSGRPQMLKVTTAEWTEPMEYLVPLGAVTLISDTKSIIQLRELTKQSIKRMCYRLNGEIPEKRLLSSLQRHFPAPRPSVVDRLADLGDQQVTRPKALSWTRLSDMSMPADS